MNHNMKVALAGLGLIAVVFIAGCAVTQSYGKNRLTAFTADKTTIETLAKNWRDYDIYYTGTQPKIPWGILFDKKDDGRTLTSKYWVKIEDGNSVLGKAQAMLSFWPTTRLFTILGPENEFYGYVFTRWDGVITKLIAPNSLYVYDLKLHDRELNASFGGIN